MSTLALLFSPSGRIGRGRFWWAVLLMTVFAFVAAMVVANVMASSGVRTEADVDRHPLYRLAMLVLVWQYFAVTIKRLHDRDKAGWWSLLVLVPVVGWIWWLIACGLLAGTDGANGYGDDPALS